MSITQMLLGTAPKGEIVDSTVQQCIAGSGGPLWLDVQDPTEDDLAWLANTFAFHPMALDDCRHDDQHSKVDEYEGYLFVSMAIPRRQHDATEIAVDELQAFLGKSYLVTVHRGELAVLATVPGLFCREPATNKRGNGVRRQADFLLYLCADVLVDKYFPLLDVIDDEMDELEDQILENPTQALLHRLFTLKQQLVFLRKLAGPLRETINALADRPYPEVRRSTSLYYRNVYDHLARIYEIIETSRDLLGNSLDAYLSTVSNRLNEVMKRLTLVTTVFMPISFIVGFGGMNFTSFIPFEEPWAFTLLVLALACTPMFMIIWFRRSKWV